MRLRLSLAAEYLGMSETSLRRTVARHLIPYIDPPFGPIVFEQSDLDEFLVTHRQGTATPPVSGTTPIDFALMRVKRDALKFRKERGL